jgi:hypothetical protein
VLLAALAACTPVNPTLSTPTKTPAPQEFPTLTPTASEAASPEATSPGSESNDYPGDGLTYTVQPGDSLTKIAGKAGTTSKELIRLNATAYPSLETNPSAIEVGWVLRLPPGAEIPASGPEPDANSDADETGGGDGEAEEGPLERVLVISVDGLRADALFETPAPNIFELAGRGAFTWTAQNVLPPVTLPNHASMLSGVDTWRHGMEWNGYEPDRGHIPVPTVFSIVHDAGGYTVMVISKDKLLHLNIPGSIDNRLFLQDEDDIAVARQAASIVASDFDLMLVHIYRVDDAGHTYGWMSPEYLEAVSHADEAIGTILNGLRDAGKTGTTLVIVTADHGGEGIEHTVDVPANRTIPWVIAGPGVQHDYQLTTLVGIMDTAATVLFALGLEVPEDWQGEPITEAFVVP